MSGCLGGCGDPGTEGDDSGTEGVDALAGEALDCTGWPNGFYSIQLRWLEGTNYQVHVHDHTSDDSAYGRIEVSTGGDVLVDRTYDSSIGTHNEPGSVDEAITIDASSFSVTLTAMEQSGSCVIFGNDLISHWWESGSSDDPVGEPGQQWFVLSRTREY
jgi:hypothetical protein